MIHKRDVMKYMLQDIDEITQGIPGFEDVVIGDDINGHVYNCTNI